jgi:hypothetical protein
MKSSFNKNAGPKEILEFISKTMERAPTPQDGFETLAISLLPPLREARQSGSLEAKAANIPAAYDWLMDDLDFDDLSEKIRAVPEASVKSFCAGLAADSGDPLKKAQQLRNHILGLSEEDYIRLCRAFESVMPPGIQSSIDTERGAATLEDEARETQALAAALSAEEIAQQLAERAKAGGGEKIGAAVYDVMQQCTPARLESLIGYVNDNMGGAAVALLVKRFWDFSEELLQAAADGNFTQPRNPGKMKAFGRSLRDTLTVLEEGLQQAGFTVPPALGAALSEAFDSGRLFRNAVSRMEADRLKHGTDDEIAVSKPLQFRKPGFSL